MGMGMGMGVSMDMGMGVGMGWGGVRSYQKWKVGFGFAVSPSAGPMTGMMVRTSRAECAAASGFVNGAGDCTAGACELSVRGGRRALLDAESRGVTG